MQCPKCNMNVSDTAKMCLHCGTSLQQPVNQSSQVVQNNGLQNNLVQNNVVQNNVVQGVNAQQQVVNQIPEENNNDEENYNLKLNKNCHLTRNLKISIRY